MSRDLGELGISYDMEKALDPITMNVVQNVTDLMERLRMKAADVRRAGDLGQTTMHDLLVRHRSPQVDTLAKIASGLNVEPYVLLFEPDKRDALDQAMRTIGRGTEDEILRFEAMARAFLGIDDPGRSNGIDQSGTDVIE